MRDAGPQRLNRASHPLGAPYGSESYYPLESELRELIVQHMYQVTCCQESKCQVHRLRTQPELLPDFRRKRQR